MEMIKVESSNIESIGHDGVDLYVAYHNGRLYEYQNVSKPVYEALMAAPSKGRYFNEYIKNNYPYQRLR